MPRAAARSPVLAWLVRTHVSLMALLVPLLLKLLPIRTVLWLLTPPAWLAPYRRLRPQRIAAIIRRRLRRPRVMRRRACLRRGLLLLHFLRLAGRPARLHIAALAPPPEQARMQAHCWITLDGRPYGNMPDGPSATLLCHPS